MIREALMAAAVAALKEKIEGGQRLQCIQESNLCGLSLEDLVERCLRQNIAHRKFQRSAQDYENAILALEVFDAGADAEPRTASATAVVSSSENG